jgi:tripartite motif-containing protein 71
MGQTKPAAARFRFGALQTELIGLASPMSAAVANDGMIFVADAGDHRITMFAPDGRQRGAFGSLGKEPGKFHAPSSIAISDDDLIFVTDSGNDRVQVLGRDGSSLRQWGSRGLDPGQFCQPRGIALQDDRVYVADTGNHRVQVFDASGMFIEEWGGLGRGDGQFIAPVDVAIDHESDEVFVLDADNNRVQRFTADGVFIKGWGDFGPFGGLLNNPQGIAVHAGQVFVTDTGNHRVQVFDREGELLRQWGVHDPMAHEGKGKIHYPFDVAIGGFGDDAFAVLCEPQEHRCQVFRAAAAGATEEPRQGIGAGEQTHFGQHMAIDALDAGGLMMIAEPENHFVYLFDLRQQAPIIISQIGQRGLKFGQFLRADGLLVDATSEQAWIADASTARLQMFSLDYRPEEAVKFAPFMWKFVRGYDLRDPRFAPEDRLPWPLTPDALKRDPKGMLHVVDSRNGSVMVFDDEMQCVRRIGRYGMGAGQLREPSDVAFSPDGAITYVVDAGNHRVQAFDGEGKPIFAFGAHGTGDGQFRDPFGIAVAPDGSVFVSDRLRDDVQKFDGRGRFLMKWGTRGVEHGQFWQPAGLAIDPTGGRQRVMVIDHGNHRAQMFSLDGEWLGTFGAGKVALKSQQRD